MGSLCHLGQGRQYLLLRVVDVLQGLEKEILQRLRLLGSHVHLPCCKSYLQPAQACWVPASFAASVFSFASSEPVARCTPHSRSSSRTGVVEDGADPARSRR